MIAHFSNTTLVALCASKASFVAEADGIRDVSRTRKSRAEILKWAGQSIGEITTADAFPEA